MSSGSVPSRPAAVSGTGVIAILALLLSLAALVFTLLPQFQPSHLMFYSFSSASNAVRSQARMEANLDVEAIFAYQSESGEDDPKEKLKTLQIDREKTFKDKTVVFFSFEEKGKRKYQTQIFEKNSKSGRWVPTRSFDLNIDKDDAALAKEMQEWRSKSTN